APDYSSRARLAQPSKDRSKISRRSASSLIAVLKEVIVLTTRRLAAGLLIGLALSVVPAAMSVAAAPLTAATCESVASRAFPDATITSAQVTPAGTFTPPGAQPTASLRDLPAFCRVAATL